MKDIRIFSPDGQRRRGSYRRTLLATAILFGIALILYSNSVWHFVPGVSISRTLDTAHQHPISRLIAESRHAVAALDVNHDLTVNQAAKAYRVRRGRHPPPGFDKWVAFARSRGRSVNELFFDQIYEDLEPFWGLRAGELRKFSASYKSSITIRAGKAWHRIDPAQGFWYVHKVWVTNWLEGIEEIVADLPDMDLAIDDVDEARIIVPWEDMVVYMDAATRNRHVRNPTIERPILDTYSSYPDPPEFGDWEGYKWDDETPLWHRVRAACPFTSPVKTMDVVESGYPHFADTGDVFVRNLTSSRYVCDEPDLFNFHSAFMRPGAPSTTTKLYPLFGSSKIVGISNGILLPAGVYLTNAPDASHEHLFTGGSAEHRQGPWEKKKHKAFWRGSDSGGGQNPENWRFHQRPRMVSMMNGTSVAAQVPYMKSVDGSQADDARSLPDEAEATRLGAPFSFPWPRQTLAALASVPPKLGEWVSELSEAGFTNLPYWLSSYYEELPSIDMAEVFQYKYLPDVDGYAYSGRYNAFLDSSSLPIKATVYSEWHHSRLVPWQHFVPMDNTMRDWWGILEYFAGFNALEMGVDSSLHREAHDKEAQGIALQGMKWAEAHLTRDDMIVYIYRLLLEYARVCDDRRENMGWTGDL